MSFGYILITHLGQKPTKRDVTLNARWGGYVLTQGSVLGARNPYDRWIPVKIVDLGATSIATLLTPQIRFFFFFQSSEESLQGIAHELFDSWLMSLGRNKNSKSCSLNYRRSLPSLQRTLGQGMGCAHGPGSCSFESRREHVYEEWCGQLRKATFGHFESCYHRARSHRSRMEPLSHAET